MSALPTDPLAAHPDRLALTSPDLTQALLQHLQEAAPQVFREGKIDFTRLREALGNTLDGDAERYGLSWAGKREAFQQIKVTSTATLRPQPADSVRWDTTENAIIEGDNLEVLKLLQKPYHGQVKLIYIDPPYNTGNEFIYPDNFREGLTDYLRYSGQLTEAGTAASSNRDTSGRYHSAWLSMMYPRLLLARNLLREDGVIFVSIDDHEVHNLRLLMDEVFGEENFVACITWEKRFTRSNNARMFASLTEYLILYRKSEKLDEIKEPRNEKADSTYSNPDNDPRGVWTSVSYVNPATKTQRPNLAYDLVNPITGKIVSHPSNAWKYEEKTYERHLAENRLYWGKSGDYIFPRLKKFLSEMDGGMVPVNLWSYDDTGTTDEGSRQLDSLFDDKVFDFPKPARLIRRMLRMMTSTNTNDLIVDFFAGSGTTAQAVLEANEEDSGNRRFLLVQLPEPTGKANYPTIAHITRERVRRVVDRLDKAEAGTLSFDPARAAQWGFRAFSLASSNFHVWDDADPAAQLALFADNRVHGRTDDDRLWEIILKAGLPLGSALTPFDAAGLPSYTLAGGQVVLCVAAPLTREVLRALLAPPSGPPQLVICLDAAFQGSDADAIKTNAVLEARGLKITFKTV